MKNTYLSFFNFPGHTLEYIISAPIGKYAKFALQNTLTGNESHQVAIGLCP
jgi:hypothetical protein